MIMSNPLRFIFSVNLFAILIGGCNHTTTADNSITLDGFSEKNYIALDNNVGKSVCVVGKLSIDSIGVYFPLQPLENDDIIDVGFSRINTGLNFDYARQKNLKDGKTYKVCGTLRDMTPFRTCETNFCKWYELQGAKIQ